MAGSTQRLGAARDHAAPQLRSLLQERSEIAQARFADESERLFKIRTADSSEGCQSASILIQRMYATRGYTTSGLNPEAPNVITLLATEDDETIGTISVGFDTPYGLLADDLFADEIDALRLAGRRVCEFTKLAIDSAVKSRRVLAYMFHTAYVWAHRLRRFDDLLIEVNPRHVRYYERMLGFVVAGPQRMNRRVDAPAVLMRLDFAHAREQIARFGGQGDDAVQERSLYPYFFSPTQEAGIVGRLRHAQWQLPAGTAMAA